LKNKKIVPQF